MLHIMEREFFEHIHEEPVNRGGVNTGSVVSVSSRGSTTSAQMVYDNSTISSTGSYQLQHPYDWHPGLAWSESSLAGSGSLSSMESWGTQSAPLESGPTLAQQAPPPQNVRVEIENRQNGLARERLGRPTKSRSNLDRLISAFSPTEALEGSVDDEQITNQSAEEIVKASRANDEKAVEAADIKDTKVSIEELIDEIEKKERVKLRKEFDELLATPVGCVPGDHRNNCRTCFIYFRMVFMVLSVLFVLFWLPPIVMVAALTVTHYPNQALMAMYIIEGVLVLIAVIYSLPSLMRARALKYLLKHVKREKGETSEANRELTETIGVV